MKRGIATLPLHRGRAPAWLFQRMVRMAREIALVMAERYGPAHLLERLADPFWFQAFGCFLGFDWHSSGLTTTVCGALKEGLRGLNKELDLFVAGGKGRTARQTPGEIASACQLIGADAEPLIYASRMAAKVDSSALQDGYRIYHHCFLFTQDGHWAVVQQGMNEDTGLARRYHWFSEIVPDFVVEPHAAICCDQRGPVLNLVARESETTRSKIAQLSRESPDRLIKEIKKGKALELPSRHHISLADLNEGKLASIFLKTYEKQPADFQAVLDIVGVGAKTIRALTLLSELLFGATPSPRDPARFSFAHGGKDGHPYPVDRDTYERTIQILHNCARAARLGRSEKLEGLRRLSLFYPGVPDSPLNGQEA